MTRATALRYALAPACVALATLLHLSPAGPFLHPTGPFVIAVLAVAWFGGAGPGFLAALLSTFALPLLIAPSYPLLGGFLDLPRFITFALIGLAVGLGASRSRRAEAALRRSEQELEKKLIERTRAVQTSEERYARVMAASDDGVWEWNPATDEMFASARARQLWGIAEKVELRTRADLVAHGSIHPEDRPRIEETIRASLAGPAAGFEIEYRVVDAGELRWIRSRGKVFADAQGQPLLTGAVTDVTERKLAEEALRESGQRYERAMAASEAGNWDWDVRTDKFYVSPKALELGGFPPGTTFAGRSDYVARAPMHPEDSAKWERAVKDLFAGTGERLAMEVRYFLRGETRWYSYNAICVRDDTGKVVRWTGSATDVTERKRAEEALRLSEERYALAVQASGEGHWDWKIAADEFYASPRWREISGFAPDEELGTRAQMLARYPFHPEDRPKYEAAVAAHFAGRTPRLQIELRITPHGKRRWVRFTGMCLRDAAGAPVRWAGSIMDITEQKRAEEALRISEERYARAMEGSDAGHWDWNIVTDEMFVSERAREMLALPAGKLPPRRSDIMALVPQHPDDAAAMHREVAASIGGGDHQREYRVLPRPGEVRWVRSRGKVYRDARGAAVRMTGSLTDITERKLAADALRESEERYARAMEATEAGHWEWDLVTHQVFHSPRFRELYGVSPEEKFADRDAWKARQPVSGAERERQEQALQAAIADPAKRYDVELSFELRPGEVRWLRSRGKVFRDTDGRPLRIAGATTDITARKLAEDDLRESEARFRALTELSSDWFWRQDENLRFTYMSNQAAALGGFSPESSIGKLRWELPGITPLSSSWAEHQAVLAARQPFRDLELSRQLPDGSLAYYTISGAPIFDEQGRFKGYQGIGRSITERKSAEEELKRLERQLRQAQRLESMGTLAGGIAHDFNNILGAILGYGEMALRDAAQGSRLRRDLDSIMAAGERGRALVDRVLAFSRSGVGERVPVHVEKVVREALDLLSAKLPPNVTLHAKLHTGPAAMLGDATQVHQVLMNLATNAIQAMPSGGTLRVALDALRVEAARAPTIGTLAPGDYLMLQVADTGTGIAPEILDRIFDPFFTTKEVGTGTGLGLSLVHGIVSELGGAIDVASTPGAGSTFTVYLPRSGDAADAFEQEEPELPRGDGQRVLVVDDEEPLVRLATRTLEELGYAPTGFTSSSAALAAFRADPQRFDALITDERMPGLSGSALIREVRGIRERIPVVLMSGFVGGAVASRARDAGAEEVLKKPLSARDLAASLARVLHP